MRTVLLSLLFLFLVSLSYAQVTTVAVSKQPPNISITTYTYYNAGGNPQYVCKAISNQPSYSWSVTPSTTQGTLTSIVVNTNVGTVTMAANHGLNVNNIIVVSGSTTAALNGTYTIQTGGAVTGGSTTAFTITTSGVGNATYNTAALTVSTTAPRTTTAIWSIEQFVYNASSNVIIDQFANGNTAHTNICDNRSTTGFN
jgi:hypothetical protein